MKIGYKTFLGFVALLLIAGVSANAMKTGAINAMQQNSMQADSDSTKTEKVKAEAPVDPNSIIDEVIWIVGDEPILKSDVENLRLQSEMEGFKFSGDPDCRIPEQIAVQKLFLHQAQLDSLNVTESEVMQRVDQQINGWIQLIGSKEKLEEYRKMTISQLRSQLHDDFKDRLLIDKMQRQLEEDVKVSPSQVRAYFKNLPEDSIPFVPTEVEVEIIMRQPKISQEEINRVKEELRNYTDRINKGETTFATLARFYSEDPGSARQGGELDYMGRGMLDPAFANVAFNLTDPSKISKIVESEFGYHIIQLIDKRGDKIKVRHILRKPHVSQQEIDEAFLRMDSIGNDIKNKKLSFELAASYFSDDKDTRSNHGLMANTSEGMRTSRFQMKDLPTEVARVVDTLKVDEISAPFQMVNSKGKTVVAIVKLKNRIEGHRAKITEDFQVMQDVVLQNEKKKKIHDWVVNKIKNTYVKVNDRYKNCDFEYEGWVK